MIDLKSDLMAMPTEAMWEAMRGARSGWVVTREDPNVRQLEAMGAELVGTEAALYVPTCRIGILVGLMTYCSRGNQIIAGQNAHLIWCQEWGLAAICSAFVRTVAEQDGVLRVEAVQEAITESRFSHQPVTDLVCIENTHNGNGGRVTTVEQTQAICQTAHGHGAKVLIDGARLLYAAAALDVPPRNLVEPADAVVFSLIKGLGAPMGALLCASKTDIDRAFHHLGVLGAQAIHRAGLFAAAGIVALETGRESLKEDIRRAQAFARRINAIDGVKIDLPAVESNIVMADISDTGMDCASFLELLEGRGIRAHRYTASTARFTFHRGVDDAGAEQAARAIDLVAKTGKDS